MKKVSAKRENISYKDIQLNFLAALLPNTDAYFADFVNTHFPFFKAGFN
jgi:hypothetical protein